MKSKSFLLGALIMFSMYAEAQNLIVPKSGDPIKGYNLEFSDKYIFYTLTPQDEGQIYRIEKGLVLLIRRSDGSTMNELVSHVDSMSVIANYPEIAEEDIHGNLIAKGNCVFIPTNSFNDYEKAGQERLKELIKELGYWVVVDRPEQAHFILQFQTVVRGEDHSFLIVRPRKYYREYPTPDSFYSAFDAYYKTSKNSKVGNIISCSRSNEEIGRNVSIAERFFRQIKEVVTNLEGKVSRKFFAHHDKYLDADAEDNNRGGCGYINDIK